MFDVEYHSQEIKRNKMEGMVAFLKDTLKKVSFKRKYQFKSKNKTLVKQFLNESGNINQKI